MRSLALIALVLLLLPSAGWNQPFTVELTPLTPLVLPDSGGTFSYRLSVTNLGPTISADIWGTSSRPSGSAGPSPGPVTQTFQAGETMTWERSVPLTQGSPVGYYTLRAYVGLHPGAVWAGDTLQFQKQMLTGGVIQEWTARFNGMGNYEDWSTNIVADDSDNLFVTGYCTGNGSSYDYMTIKYSSSGIQQWIAQYNGPGNDDDEAYDLACDEQGNVYVTGGSYGNGSNYDYATIKYDSSGVRQWLARYNGPGNSHDIAVAIIIDDDGNVYVTGYSCGIGGDEDYTTVKYDSTGNQQWAARYDGPASNNDRAYSLASGSDGDIYVTGESNGVGTSDDCATIKYNSSGDQIWVARHNGSGNYEDCARSLVLDAEDNIYVTGTSYGSLTSWDYVTIKYDSAGIQQWIAIFNGLGDAVDQAFDLAVDGAGNVYITGFTQIFVYNDDCATIKYDPYGVEQWVAYYSGPGAIDDYGYKLALDDGGNVIVMGSSYGDITTIKYNLNGVQMWVAGYNGPANAVDHGLGGLHVDIAGNIYVTGSSNGMGTNEDYVTIKYSSGTLLNWQSPTATAFGAPLPQECRLLPPSPNPFNPLTALGFTLPAAGHIRLKVYDTAGREVRTLVDGWREAGNHELTFDASGLAAGAYFVRLEAGDFTQVQKVVLLK
ncbi:MAG: T9SS C-terminal target domain-containing protein [Candidatus Zixiibacteriota bacterium]|nr:MAG: T9SS C-terminal target domain-containing protein [candidate division Zixibacteria bacterium]